MGSLAHLKRRFRAQYRMARTLTSGPVCALPLNLLRAYKIKEFAIVYKV